MNIRAERQVRVTSMTEQKKKLLKAKIAAALYHEEGRVPTKEEVEKWTKFAKVLYTAVLGLHFEREQQKKEGQLAIFSSLCFATTTDKSAIVTGLVVSTAAQSLRAMAMAASLAAT